MTECTDRLALVAERVRSAAQSAGRDPRRITLIAVSKTQPKERVAELITVGHRAFGESTLQDAMTKIPHFASADAIWHFIGHVQSNKARAIAENFSWVHSVDSMKLAAKLSEAAIQVGRRLNFLLQVNITNDPAKFGVSAHDILPFAENLCKTEFPGLVLKGLMTMGPQGADRSDVQRVFANLRTLQESCAQSFGAEWFEELSMGMSDDFEVAAAEGATMVRVGTAIFGVRK